MNLSEHSLLKKLYCAIQKDGFIVIYILWFLMEIILNNSALELTIPLPIIYYRTAQRILKFSLLAYIVFFLYPSKREIVIILPLTIIFYYSARLSHFHELFYTWLLIVGMKKTTIERISMANLIMLSICIPVFAVLCYTGILADAGISRGDSFRTALGFIHPNSFGVRAFVLCACLFYTKRHNLRWWQYLLTIIFVVFIWLVPNSRTSVLCISVLIVLKLLYSWPSFCVSVFRKLVDFLLILLAVLANIGTVLLSIFYSPGNALMSYLDKLLSGRLSIAHSLYQEFGVSVIGQRIYVTMSERIFAGLGNTAINFDNSYMRILLHWGILPYLLVSVFIIISLLYEKRRNNPTLFIILFIILVYSCSEKILYQGTYSVFILAVSDLLYNKLSRGKTTLSFPVP